MTKCINCGAKQGIVGLLSTDLGAAEYRCPKCKEELAAAERKAQESERQRVERLIAVSRRVVVTTTPGIDGHRVRKYLGIESVEYVIGTGIFSEVTGSVADVFGARSTAFETKLQAAKQQAMDLLRFRAAEKGANAVVAVDLDYAEFSGNRVALIINGTLVAVEPVKAEAGE